MRGDQGSDLRRPDKLGQRFEDVAGGGRVEVAGGLVGQEEARRVGDGAGDGDALLLAARQLRRAGASARSLDPHVGQEFAWRAVRLELPRQPANELRDDDVLERAELAEEVMELVDEADLDATDRSPLGIGEASGGPAADHHVAAIRAFEKSSDVGEWRRLPGARRSGQRHQFASGQGEVRVLQHLQRAGAGPVGTRHPGQRERGCGGFALRRLAQGRCGRVVHS